MFELEIDGAKFKLPLTALLRQPNQGCHLLLTNLGKNDQSSNIVLGSAFFQQFMAEHVPATSKENAKVILYKKNDSLDSTSVNVASGKSKGWKVFGILLLTIAVVTLAVTIQKRRNKKQESASDTFDREANMSEALQAEKESENEDPNDALRNNLVDEDN